MSRGGGNTPLHNPIGISTPSVQLSHNLRVTPLSTANSDIILYEYAKELIVSIAIYLLSSDIFLYAISKCNAIDTLGKTFNDKKEIYEMLRRTHIEPR